MAPRCDCSAKTLARSRQDLDARGSSRIMMLLIAGVCSEIRLSEKGGGCRTSPRCPRTAWESRAPLVYKICTCLQVRKLENEVIMKEIAKMMTTTR